MTENQKTNTLYKIIATLGYLIYLIDECTGQLFFRRALKMYAKNFRDEAIKVEQVVYKVETGASPGDMAAVAEQQVESYWLIERLMAVHFASRDLTEKKRLKLNDDIARVLKKHGLVPETDQ